MFILCDACKVPPSDCDHPSLDLPIDGDETLHIRSCKEYPCCSSCSSTFIDRDFHTCYSCLEKGLDPPHTFSSMFKCAERGCGAPSKVLSSWLEPAAGRECSIMAACSVDDPAILCNIQPCKHHACLDCFLLHIKHKITGQVFQWDRVHTQFTLPCFHPGCKSAISDTNIIRLCGPHDYNKFKDVAIKLFVKLESGGVLCPFPDCGDAILGIPSKDIQLIIPCPSCKRHFCQHCRGEATADGKCPEESKKGKASTDDLAFKKYLQDNDGKRCPTCGAACLKEDGCNRVQCGECKKNFCWICMVPTGREDLPNTMEGKYLHWKTSKNCTLWPPKK